MKQKHHVLRVFLVGDHFLVWTAMWDPQFSDVVAHACKIRVPLCCFSQENTMLTSP